MHWPSRRIAIAVAMTWMVAAASARADEQVATSGQVQATLSYVVPASSGYEDFRLTVDRAGQRLFDAPLDCFGCAPARIFENRTAVFVRDLDGDGEPEAWADLYTGGAHCCTVTELARFTGSGYERVSRNWFDAGYRLRDLDGDGIPEFKSSSTAFKYLFSSFAESPFPIKAFEYRAGVFTDVTAEFPALVRKDAARFLRRYRAGVRRRRPALGMLAGWVADQYVLGHRRRAHRFLARELRAGHLVNHDGLPSGRSYVRQLKRHLRLLARTTAVTAAPRLTASAGGGRIVIAGADGTGRRVLGRGHASSLSPNRAWVAVTDSDETGAGAANHRVKLFPSRGGRPVRRVAVGCFDVRWSPDSRRVACVDWLSTTRRLLMIDVATGAVRVIARGELDSDPSFSPDARRVAYVRRGALTVTHLSTGASRVIRRRAAAPVWGARRIAFSTVRRGGPVGRILNVATIRPDGSRFRRLTRYRPRFFESGLSPVAWSADGRRLLAGLFGQDTRVAYAVDARRGGARRLSPMITPSALSRNGRFIIGSTDTESFEPEASDVVRVPWAGGSARVLLRRADDPSYVG